MARQAVHALLDIPPIAWIEEAAHLSIDVLAQLLLELAERIGGCIELLGLLGFDLSSYVHIRKLSQIVLATW